MFKDKVRAVFKAGKGGDGKVSFYASKKPSGGNGGDGGDVYLEGANNIYDLSFINQDAKFIAGNGVIGGASNLKGAKGESIIIKVPLITNVYTSEGKLVLSITKNGERKQLLKGGEGGLGNWFFRTKGVDHLNTSTKGKEGGTLHPTLELVLYSDIIFIGFPNAGKSSILNALTRAESKVAPYAFTTLNPVLGRLDGITLMDLPGLIEGTFEGKGLGTNFVRHTKTSKIIVHLVSLESENITEEYQKIREEIRRIDLKLFEKKEIVILTKSDLVTAEIVNKKVEEMRNLNKDLFVCSVYDYDSLENLKKVFKSNIQGTNR